MKTFISALVFAFGFFVGQGCENERSCDVDLDAGAIQDRVCDAVELVAECMAERFGNFDPQGPEFESQIDECIDQFDFCTADPSASYAVTQNSRSEIRGETNECVG